MGDPLSPACNRTIGTLAAGAAVTYTCTLRNVKASFDNVAVAKGNAGASAVSATDSAPVKVAALKPPKKPVVPKLKKKHAHAKPPRVVTHKRPMLTV